MMIKAVAGGGGRGMRAVHDADGARRGLRALPLRGAAPPSATATSTSSGSCRAPATSRCRSSATAPAPSATSASASAASSGGTRSSSRSRRARALAAAPARPLVDAAVRLARGGALPQPRHLRVPGRRARGQATTPVRLHRGQPAPAGRAHGHRGGDRRRPGARRSCASRPGPSLAELGLAPARRPGAARLRRAGARQHGDHGRRRRRHDRPAARSPPSSRRPAGRARRYAAATRATARTRSFDSLLAKVIVPRAVGRLRRRRGQGLPRAVRVPASRAWRPTCLPAGPAAPSRVRRRPHRTRASSTSTSAELVACRRRSAPAVVLCADRTGRRRPPSPARGSTRRDPLAVLAHGKTDAGRAPQRSAPVAAPPPASYDTTGWSTCWRCGAHAGHDRQHRRAEGDDVHAGQRAARHGSDEDGARHHRRGGGIVRRARRRGGRHRVRRAPARLRRAGRRRGRRGGRPARRSTSTTSAPISPRSRRAARDRARRGAARGGGAPPQDRPAHGAREHRRPVRPGHVRRVRRRWSSPRSGAAARSRS